MLSVSPLKCLQDEPVTIEIKDQEPGAEVTLTSSTSDQLGKGFFIYAHYRADSNGIVLLSRDPSLGGTYKGIFPMGPIVCFKPDPDDFQYMRYLHQDVSIPMRIKLNLLKGHLDVKQAFNPDPDLILASVNHERIFLAPNTQRIIIREGRVRGTLFLPEGEGPFPGVIEIFGVMGGLYEFKSAQFAARGVAALSLAYFNYEDLPKEFNEADLSYFEEAVQFLLRHDQIKKNGIGFLGLSKGGDLAVSAGTFIPEVKAVVCINGVTVNTVVPLKTKEKVIPPARSDRTRAKVNESGHVSVFGVMDDPADCPYAQIPIHEADAEFLFLCGEDDQVWDCAREADRAASILKSHGKNNCQIFKYEGTGHILEPPYTPFAYATMHRISKIITIWGGNALQHTAAEVDSWNRTLEFFKRVLS